MKMVLKALPLAMIAGVIGTAGAWASTIDLTDNGAYTQGTSQASGSVDGVSWTINPVPSSASLTYTTFDGTGGTGMNPDLAFENDGIGITDDEVTYPRESLSMTFSQEVTVTGVYVLDLYGDENVTVYADGVAVGQIVADPVNAPNAQSTTTDGYSYIAFSTGVTATTLTFMPGNTNDNAGSPDFALAAITLAPIPVPAAGLMLLGGIGALGALKRRRAKAA